VKTIEITSRDGSIEIFESDRKLTKTAILNMVKEALESEDTKEIKIK